MLLPPIQAGVDLLVKMLKVNGGAWATLIPEPALCKKILSLNTEDLDNYFRVVPQCRFWVSAKTSEYSALIYLSDFTHFA